jgi:hypothetical protein
LLHPTTIKFMANRLAFGWPGTNAVVPPVPDLEGGRVEAAGWDVVLKVLSILGAIATFFGFC